MFGSIWSSDPESLTARHVPKYLLGAQAGDWAALKLLVVLGFRGSLSGAQKGTSAGRRIRGRGGKRGPDQRHQPETNNTWGKAHPLRCFNVV